MLQIRESWSAAYSVAWVRGKARTTWFARGVAQRARRSQTHWKVVHFGEPIRRVCSSSVRLCALFWTNTAVLTGFSNTSPRAEKTKFLSPRALTVESSEGEEDLLLVHLWSTSSLQAGRGHLVAAGTD